MTGHGKVQELLRVKAEAPIRFDWHTSTPIVVDVQRWFAGPEYGFHVRPTEEIVTMMMAATVAA